MQTLGEQIGKTLIQLREERNLTAKELAGLTGKSPSYISKLETGNVRNPRKETLRDILTYMYLNKDEVNEIINSFYGEEVEDIKKVDNTLYVKNEKVNKDEVEKKIESNTDFIEKSDLPTSIENTRKEAVQKLKNEEIIFQFSNRSDLSVELSTIAHQLQETAHTLVNRNMLDVRYDSIKLAVNQASDRLEIFKVTYDMYVEKLIREGNKVNV